jgi:hypothetical protein
VRVVVRGGFLIRDITRAIADVASTTTPTYAALAVIYQINDRACVSRTDGAVVKQSGREEWLRDVGLFCDVLKIAATRAIVVTMDAACYPAFDSVRAEYDGEVEHLRRALTEHGVAWSRGPQLNGLPTYDGWHYDATGLDSVVDAVFAWLQEAQPIGGHLTNDAGDTLKRALAPIVQGGGQLECWWELRSFVSGGSYVPWCRACDQWIRGGHTDGKSHADKVLRKYGLDVLPGPPVALASEISLPPGTPKVLAVDASLALAAWFTAPITANDAGCVLKTIPEAGTAEVRNSSIV